MTDRFWIVAVLLVSILQPMVMADGVSFTPETARLQAHDGAAFYASPQSLTFAFQGVTAVYNAGTQEIICNGRKSSLQLVAGKGQLELIVDRNTIEIFGNDGQIYMPLPASNPPGNALISLTCAGDNATFSSLTVHKLISIWTGSSN